MRYLRHERCSGGEEDERDEGEQAGDGGAQTSAAGEESAEEGEHLEEEGNQEEDPAEAPHVVVVCAGGAAAVAADDVGGRIARITIPSLAECWRWTGLATVLVAFTTEIEVCPLGDVASAADAGSVGPEEVRLVEGCCVGEAGEDNEPKEHERAGDENEAGDADGGVW